MLQRLVFICRNERSMVFVSIKLLFCWNIFVHSNRFYDNNISKLLVKNHKTLLHRSTNNSLTGPVKKSLMYKQ